MTEREHQFIREYCTAMRPLTVDLDILQGEDNTFYGILLPTLETLMFKTLELSTDLQILENLPEAVVTKTRFSEVLESEDALLAAVTLPKFKLHWLRTQERKDKAKASLLAGCRKIVLDKDQRADGSWLFVNRLGLTQRTTIATSRTTGWAWPFPHARDLYDVVTRWLQPGPR
ncbi:uncharacterized protein LOC106633426 isoform X2 [Haplochromis burtoni]|uniref:uncharacterized protein LOC106633426 isoform X2 n=1 Tax=Haplochromis burtoni TaxID=8153 RepID=UPI0006C9C908|nr:uncharacterized protein LOC106633426 isoform X2 [Haplochromis burtoni]